MPQEQTAIQRVTDTVVPATRISDFLFLVMTKFNLKLSYFIIKKEIKIILICAFHIHTSSVLPRKKKTQMRKQ